MLREVVDYPAVDAEVRANDIQLYRRFFVDKMSTAQLKQRFQRAYNGFDLDTDWAKVQAWYASNGTRYL